MLQNQSSVGPLKSGFMQKFLISLKAVRQPWKDLILWDVELHQVCAEENFRHFLYSFLEQAHLQFGSSMFRLRVSLAYILVKIFCVVFVVFLKNKTI